MGGILFTEFNPDTIANYLATTKSKFPEGGVLALVAEAEKERIPELQNLFAQQDYPLVGAIFPALLNGDAFFHRGVALLPFKKMPNYTLAPLHDALASPDSAIARITAALEIPANGEPKATLCMIFDAMTPNVATLLDTLYLNLADRVNYAGVNAGSETFQPIPCLFDREQFIQGGVLAMVLPGHGGALLEHGYGSQEQGLTASAATGNKVSYIDWRPAIEVYQQLADEQYGIEVTRENFYTQAVHFPLGILRADGEVVVRIPVAMEEDGSLYCVGEIPENSLLTLLKAVDTDSRATVEQLAQRLRDYSFDTLMLFYCAGRRMHMGERAVDELQAMAQHLPEKSIIGALSLGEIGQGKTGHYPLFQNATLVCCPWDSA